MNSFFHSTAPANFQQVFSQEWPFLSLDTLKKFYIQKIFSAYKLQSQRGCHLKLR